MPFFQKNMSHFMSLFTCALEIVVNIIYSLQFSSLLYGATWLVSDIQDIYSNTKLNCFVSLHSFKIILRIF